MAKLMNMTVISMIEKNIVLLWIECTADHDTVVDLPAEFQEYIGVQVIKNNASIKKSIRAIAPSIVCFDYDCPVAEDLSLLRQVKEEFPSIPILMISEYHNESLAVWALRSRVWDYFVKPLNTEEFVRSIKKLVNMFRSDSEKLVSRELIRPVTPKSDITELYELNTNIPANTLRTVAKAKAYMDTNLKEKISADHLAKIIGMSKSHFSRSFKQVYGLTFSDYLLEIRIKKAFERFAIPGSTIKDICYSVGFRDPAYFGRMFKRYTGLTPKQYRDSQLKIPEIDESKESIDQQARRSSDKTDAVKSTSNDVSTVSLSAELLWERLRKIN